MVSHARCASIASLFACLDNGRGWDTIATTLLVAVAVFALVAGQRRPSPKW